MAIALPMLTTEGWVVDPKLQLNRIFAHIFLTDYSQSNIYAGKVTSLQYIIAEQGPNTNNIPEKLEKAISTILKRYFDNVEVFVKEKPSTSSEDDKYNLTLEAIVYKENVSYDLKTGLVVDGSEGNFRFLVEAFESKFEYTENYQK